MTTKTRLVLTCVACGVAVFLIAIGSLDVPHALLLAACTTALALAWPDSLPDPPALNPAPSHIHAGTRQDLIDLSWWAWEGNYGVSSRLTARVHALTDDEPSLASLRQTIENTKAPTTAQVLRWLDAIDAQQGEP